jgi:hypothetical protein
MSNRLTEFLPPRTSGTQTACQPRKSLSMHDVQEAVAPVRRYIVENPTAALAAAFLAGVSLAWWIKRR